MPFMEKITSQGERIRYLRSLVGLNAKEFCRRFSISPSTYGKWENNLTVLSVTKANLLTAIAIENKIFCTVKWLIYGEGQPPKPISENEPMVTQPTSEFEQVLAVVSLEVEFLKKTHPKIETLMITDDSMSPQFNVRDYVAGTPINNVNDAKEYLDLPCIIETQDGKKRLRRIGYNQGNLFLFGTNTNYKGAPLFELHPFIIKISPVFWHRMIGNK